jgi:hypothetical protein
MNSCSLVGRFNSDLRVLLFRRSIFRRQSDRVSALPGRLCICNCFHGSDELPLPSANAALFKERGIRYIHSIRLTISKSRETGRSPTVGTRLEIPQCAFLRFGPQGMFPDSTCGVRHPSNSPLFAFDTYGGPFLKYSLPG